MNNLEKTLNKVKCTKLDGPTGPEGPYLIEIAYVAKFIDNFTDDGIEVKIMEDIPISRKEIDNKNIVTLNNINSDSYFVNSPVLITIEYLGN